MRSRAAARDEGFILVVVLWGALIIALIANGVLAAGTTNAVSVRNRLDRAVITATADAALNLTNLRLLSSRSAENLFWFGRYGERCDSAARLLRVALAGVQGSGTLRGEDLAPVIALARRFGLLTHQGANAETLDTVDALEAQLLCSATDPTGALGERLKQFARVAYSLRDRMSADNWRTLNQLSGDAVFQAPAGTVSMPVTMAWLDRAVLSMTTLSGFALDGMTRGMGWRFLSMGRRIERLLGVIAALQVAMTEGRALELDWLLELNDSTITYRSHYSDGSCRTFTRSYRA